MLNLEDQKWCCQESNCTGKGEVDEFNNWGGEENEDGPGEKIGAQCRGTSLNLTQACNGRCNYYEWDDSRNDDGVLRSFPPCSVTHMNTTQCIPEHEEKDGVYHCKNRGDEEPFMTNLEDSHALLINLENTLTPCMTGFHNPGQGFKCLESHSLDCLSVDRWCTPQYTYTCSNLLHKTATGKTIDPLMCSNQSFWEGRGCRWESQYRCAGDRPGQCAQIGEESTNCVDGSSLIKPAQGGDCGEELMCRGRNRSKWENLDVCILEQFINDGVLHCQEGEDEAVVQAGDPEKCENIEDGYHHESYEDEENWRGNTCDEHYIPPVDGHCWGDLTCQGREGSRLENSEVCIEDKYKCDGVLHCKGEEDESGCAPEVPEGCEGKHEHYGHLCDKAYKQPVGGHCERDDLMCTARDGKWARLKICLDKKFHCDNHVQCEDGQDEEDCEQEYIQRGIFTKRSNYICKSPSINIKAEGNKIGKFFPMRAAR